MNAVHTALWIASIEATRSFYLDELDLSVSREVIEDDGIVNLFVRGESETEVQFRYDPDRSEPVEPAGIDHLAFTVDDADAITERVATSDTGDVLQKPETLSVDSSRVRLAFVADPDGYRLELIETLG